MTTPYLDRCHELYNEIIYQGHTTLSMLKQKYGGETETTFKEIYNGRAENTEIIYTGIGYAADGNWRRLCINLVLCGSDEEQFERLDIYEALAPLVNGWEELDVDSVAQWASQTYKFIRSV